MRPDNKNREVKKGLGNSIKAESSKYIVVGKTISGTTVKMKTATWDDAQMARNDMMSVDTYTSLVIFSLPGYARVMALEMVAHFMDMGDWATMSALDIQDKVLADKAVEPYKEYLGNDDMNDIMAFIQQLMVVNHENDILGEKDDDEEGDEEESADVKRAFDDLVLNITGKKDNLLDVLDKLCALKR